jgi:hypothetical protein
VKKFSFFLIILLLTRIGTSFADTTTSSQAQIQNFFLGNSVSNNGNLNQVLALLVGPQGKPGVAGVAGKDGFIGLNGKDGINGLDGAPGAVGPQGPAGVAGEQGPAGPGVAVVLVSSGDTSCPAGGTKFVTADGKSSYACNGLAGSGGSGPAGPAGASVVSTEIPIGGTLDKLGEKHCLLGGSKFEVNGTITYACNGAGGGGGGGGPSEGIQSVAACTGSLASDAIKIVPTGHFSSGDKDFILTAVTLQNVDIRCRNFNQTEIDLVMDSHNPLPSGTKNYDSGDSIVCQITNAPTLGLDPKTSLTIDLFGEGTTCNIYKAAAHNTPLPGSDKYFSRDLVSIGISFHQ